jgi:RND family efflux transporter MFP subunit
MKQRGRRAPVVALLAVLAAACDTRPDDRAAAALVPVAAPPAAPRPAPPPAAGFVGVIVAGEWVEVEPKVDGRVQVVLVKPGDRVARGALLARLDVAASVHELAIARAALAEASRRFARRRRLVRGASGAVTAEELDAARRELLQERARVLKLQAARAEANVTAPFAGTVIERYLSPGALAGPGRPVLRLLGQGEPRVRFAIPEEQAAAITQGSAVTVLVGPGALPVRGRVTGVSPEVDASSRMVFAAATLEAGSALPLSTGLSARVFAAPPEAKP